MAFTDEDLKRLRESIAYQSKSNLSYYEGAIRNVALKALIARLEAAERVILSGCGSLGCQDAAYEAWRKAAGK